MYIIYFYNLYKASRWHTSSTLTHLPPTPPSILPPSSRLILMVFCLALGFALWPTKLLTWWRVWSYPLEHEWLTYGSTIGNRDSLSPSLPLASLISMKPYEPSLPMTECWWAWSYVGPMKATTNFVNLWVPLLCLLKIASQPSWSCGFYIILIPHSVCFLTLGGVACFRLNF